MPVQPGKKYALLDRLTQRLGSEDRWVRMQATEREEFIRA